MTTEIVAILGNLISQMPLVALVSYLWYQDRKEKIKQINFLRETNQKQSDLLITIAQSIDKLSLALELIKDRLR